MDITNPRVVVGAFLGAIVVVLAASMTMSSVGKAAVEMVTEIRRQFREIPGLLQGMAKPEPPAASPFRPTPHCAKWSPRG